MKGKKSIALWMTLVAGSFLFLTASQPRVEGPAAAQAELDDLAQELAQLVAEPGFRGFLRSEIAQSKNREGIVELDKFLARAARRPDAPPGLAKFEQSARDVSGKVKTARRSRLEGLDLYLPVGAHRAKWKGGEDFLIASAPLDDENLGDVIAYDVKTGNRVTLDPKRVPTQIVMVLAAEEHDTHEPPTGPGPDRDQRDVKPNVTGREPAEDPVEGEESEGSHVGIRRFLLGDVKEPWAYGAPEIYVNFGQRKGNYCTVKRVNLYTHWNIFETSPESRKWYTTWPGASQNRCRDGEETCWYFDSRVSCCGSGYYWNRIFVDVREDDGGFSERETIRTPYTGYSCSVKYDYGDDYVEHGYVWKSNFTYEYDYTQDVGNARFMWHKIH